MNRKLNNLRKKQARSMQKHQQRQAQAAAEKERTLHLHIEKMVAAYMEETKIPAAAACLVHEIETVKKDETETTQVRYWFEHHENRCKINDLHPDLAYLFELSFDLDRANELKDETDRKEKLDEGFKLLSDFLSKYKEVVEKEAKEMFDKENPQLAKADKKAAAEGKASPVTEEDIQKGFEAIKNKNTPNSPALVSPETAKKHNL